jgi:hypothetical protein
MDNIAKCRKIVIYNGSRSMDVMAILGVGALGLGLLLAILAYRLLAQSNGKQPPIYFFMASCLVFLGVGAALLYGNNLQRKALEQKTKDYNELKAQYDSKAKNLITAQDALSESKGKLWDALNLWSAAQASANNYKGENRRLTEDMKVIVEKLAPTLETLQSVQGSLAAIACSGGPNAEPMRSGTEHETRISGSIAQISAASKVAQQYVP